MQREETAYNFYFSQKHKEYRRSLIDRFIQPEEEAFVYRPTYFKGQEYTEMLPEGVTPVTSSFGDMVLLGKGTKADVTVK